MTPTQMLQTIFSYLPKSYRFVAPVCRTFQRNYLTAHGGFKETSLASTFQTPFTAQIWYNERHIGHPFHQPCDMVAQYGTLETLQFFRFKRYGWSHWTCALAAQRGDLEMVKWARENGCAWDEKTCCMVAESGNIELLKWVRENGCPWDWSTSSVAARHGHLEMLKWARENGCPWDEWTCFAAAVNGHLDILKWARANGCNWNPNMIMQSRSNQEVLAWVRDNR